MTYSAIMLKDSISQIGIRLSTMMITFPRIVLSEFNTHRMFSRNSSSTRAIPIEKRILQVENNPFIPETFGKNQKGMQSFENLNDEDTKKARAIWETALKDAIKHSKELCDIKVHKQLGNRLLEPFCWQTAIVSATDWDNFYKLRCHEDAQYEIRKIAIMMKELQENSTPVFLQENEWHLPMTDDYQKLINEDGFNIEEIKLISVGRCARVSYLSFDGKRDPRADISLANKLKTSGHFSPFEHVAKPMNCKNFYFSNFRGWISYRKFINE